MVSVCSLIVGNLYLTPGYILGNLHNTTTHIWKYSQHTIDIYIISTYSVCLKVNCPMQGRKYEIGMYKQKRKLCLSNRENAVKH